MRKRLGLGSFLVLSLVGACTSDSADDGALPDASDSTLRIDASGGGPIIDAAPPAPDATGIILPDARPSALACAGDPLPTTVATPPVQISGEVREAGISGGITTLTQEAHVAALQFTGNAVITEGDFTGAFTLSGPNSPTPVDAYLKATSDGLVDSYVFPPATISEDIPNTPIIMVAPLIFNTLLPAVAAAAQESGNGALIVAAVDCEQAAMEGAVLSITPSAGTIHYSSANGFPGQMGDFSATQSPGITYFLNLPPGDYTVDATAPGAVNLRTVNVRVFADSSSTAVIAP